MVIQIKILGRQCRNKTHTSNRITDYKINFIDRLHPQHSHHSLIAALFYTLPLKVK